ncbi:GNAT family N-acetyltransferase [Pseudoalteromonas denitrificans]|uniref:Protein N-acetyltransferase, RimJ/RimL family n=1 Tax=Pseudoalteromonas denitrificans DSM 6059 TaxID=1123010 RepID=A0A1I1R3C7_9GAMM|nr:GNAT family protein [Pseudoalteromonas denitrificans]SFD28799.1 Protein N-acetyltransferase, RimJ/RimL family [Pseudoalteromonas denitrificans DSM 6059]
MFKPQILQSQLIKLIPMTMGHLEAYRAAGNYPEMWQHMPINRCETTEVATTWMKEAINEMALGQQIAFVTLDKKTNQVIGSTRLFRLNEKDKSLEIGHTFIAPEFQRTYVNSHAKYLMLKYAFEELNMARVEICTNEHNKQSRAAIARIGGHFEGILRKHRRAPNGDYRNTAMFSIIDSEWPQIKSHLLKTGSKSQEFEHVPA